MIDLWHEHLVYGLAWIAFGAGHSVLAADRVKRRLRPWFGPWYRLVYNGMAALSIAAVWVLGRAGLGAAPPLPLPDGAMAALIVVQGAGAVMLAVALAGYDLGRLGGLSPIRNARRGISEPEDEPLRLGGLHRFVRHPLYAAALLLLWGGARDPFGVATAVWGSLYLGAGTWFEERRLLRRYGAAYARYRERVPAVLPWRGRAI